MGRFFPQKLTGKQAELFAAGLLVLAHSIDEFDSLFIEDGVCVETTTRDLEGEQEHPLFNWLSSQQGIHLLSEIAVGLLCLEEPLPPDTIQHYTAYLAVWERLSTELSKECDIDLDMLADDLTEFCGAEETMDYDTLSPEEKEKRNYELLLIGPTAEKYRRRLQRAEENGTDNQEDEFAPPELNGNDYLPMDQII
jgi:hypothetical protein